VNRNEYGGKRLAGRNGSRKESLSTGSMRSTRVSDGRAGTLADRTGLSGAIRRIIGFRRAGETMIEGDGGAE